MTWINAITLILVAAITTAGGVYGAKISANVNHIKNAVHTANGDTIGQQVDTIVSNQADVKSALEAVPKVVEEIKKL